MIQITKFKHNMDLINAKATGVSCRRGCSHCCYYPVEIIPIEGGIIIDRLKATGQKINRVNLHLQGSLPREALDHSEKRCVFLGSDDMCTIYDIRPMTCRRHMVTSDPIHCHEQDMDDIKIKKHKKVNDKVEHLLHKYKAVSMSKYLWEKLGYDFKQTED